MFINRDMMIRRLSEKSGFHQKDIRPLLKCFDEAVLEYLNEVTPTEEVSIQIVKGVKISAHIVPERERVDPRTGNPIIVSETIKPACKFSEDFRKNIQEQYDAKKDG